MTEKLKTWAENLPRRLTAALTLWLKRVLAEESRDQHHEDQWAKSLARDIPAGRGGYLFVKGSLFKISRGSATRCLIDQDDDLDHIEQDDHAQQMARRLCECDVIASAAAYAAVVNLVKAGEENPSRETAP